MSKIFALLVEPFNTQKISGGMTYPGIGHNPAAARAHGRAPRGARSQRSGAADRDRFLVGSAKEMLIARGAGSQSAISLRNRSSANGSSAASSGSAAPVTGCAECKSNLGEIAQAEGVADLSGRRF
jgi:hypothetical protein